jgi:hypothetical protein
MKQVTLHIPNNKYPHFIELAKSIKYVKKIDEEEIDGEYKPLTKKQVLDGLKEAVKEMNLVNKGKLKARGAMELFNEL